LLGTRRELGAAVRASVEVEGPQLFHARDVEGVAALKGLNGARRVAVQADGASSSAAAPSLLLDVPGAVLDAPEAVGCSLRCSGVTQFSLWPPVFQCAAWHARLQYQVALQRLQELWRGRPGTVPSGAPQWAQSVCEDPP
jgi:hypothetical protein